MALVSREMIGELTYRDLCVNCSIMDNRGRLDKVREDFKDILTREQLTRVFKKLKDKKFIVRYHNPNYVEYKQVTSKSKIIKTDPEIIKRKGLTWKARFILAGIYESISNDDGMFILTPSILKTFSKTNKDFRNFRREIQKYVSKYKSSKRNEMFIVKFGKLGEIEHKGKLYTKYCFYEKFKNK